MKPQKKNIHYQNKMHIQTKSLNFESTKMIPQKPQKKTQKPLKIIYIHITIRNEHTQNQNLDYLEYTKK